MSLQVDGSPGKFRQLDDIFETATSHLQKNKREDSDLSTAIVGKDIMSFSALNCTTSAMKRLCDIKGLWTCFSHLYIYHPLQISRPDYKSSGSQNLNLLITFETKSPV